MPDPCRDRLPWRAATLLFPYRGADASQVSFAFDGQQATVKTAETGDVQIRCSLP